MPARHLSRVLLPDPLRPTMPKNSPSATWNEMSRSATSSSTSMRRSGCSARSLSVMTCWRGTRNVLLRPTTSTAAWGCGTGQRLAGPYVRLGPMSARDTSGARQFDYDRTVALRRRRVRDRTHSSGAQYQRSPAGPRRGDPVACPCREHRGGAQLRGELRGDRSVLDPPPLLLPRDPPRGRTPPGPQPAVPRHRRLPPLPDPAPGPLRRSPRGRRRLRGDDLAGKRGGDRDARARAECRAARARGFAGLDLASGLGAAGLPGLDSDRVRQPDGGRALLAEHRGVGARRAPAPALTGVADGPATVRHPYGVRARLSLSPQAYARV